MLTLVKIEQLDAILRADLSSGKLRINISEMDIIGTKEVFNSTTLEYKLRYHRKTKIGTNLTNEVLFEFCEDNNFDIDKDLLEINVDVFDMDGVKRSFCVKDILDYVAEQEKCVLYQGRWYEYNDDYITYLEKSLEKITTIYEPKYDFSQDKHDKYIQSKLKEGGKVDDLKKKYYAERVFNELMIEEGYKNYDRNNQNLDGHIIEPMDLYYEGCMYAVKMGASSAKLCYAVEQSLSSLRLYENGKLDLPIEDKITKVALWFVLERNNHIEDENGRPDLKKLKLLMLKNSIDDWSKKVRMMGYIPLIYINYRSK